jgi:hypothetical protein
MRHLLTLLGFVHVRQRTRRHHGHSSRPRPSAGEGSTTNQSASRWLAMTERTRHRMLYGAFFCSVFCMPCFARDPLAGGAKTSPPSAVIARIQPFSGDARFVAFMQDRNVIVSLTPSWHPYFFDFQLKKAVGMGAWFDAKADYVLPLTSRALCVVDGDEVGVLDIYKGRVSTLHTDWERKDCATISSDGALLAYATRHGDIATWDLGSKKRLQTLGSGWEFFSTLSMSSDGRVLASVGSPRVFPGGREILMSTRFWDTKSGAELTPFDNRFLFQMASFVPGGDYFVAVDEDLRGRLYSYPEFMLLKRFSAGTERFTAFSCSSGSYMLAFGTEKGNICIYELASGAQRIRLSASGGAIRGLAFDEEGTPLVSVDAEKACVIWNIAADSLGVRMKSVAERGAEIWRVLGSMDAAEAYEAVCYCIRHPEEALSALRERIDAIDQKAIDELIGKLADESFATRQAATKHLRKLGPLCSSSLKRWKAKMLPLEAERRIDRLLSDMAPSEFCRFFRVIEVLERTKMAEAHVVLKRLSFCEENSEIGAAARKTLLRMSKSTPKG